MRAAMGDRPVCVLRGHGMRVESLTPVRDTLEDLFMQQVAAANRRDTAGL